MVTSTAKGLSSDRVPDDEFSSFPCEIARRVGSTIGSRPWVGNGVRYLVEILETKSRDALVVHGVWRPGEDVHSPLSFNFGCRKWMPTSTTSSLARNASKTKAADTASTDSCPRWSYCTSHDSRLP